MPKVHHVKKARKAIPGTGIQVGDSYYWWQFRYGSKQVSKTYPRPAQLTRSEYLQTSYDLEERAQSIHGNVEASASSLEDAAGELRDIASEFQSLADEQLERRENMPQGLQDGDVGQLLETRSEIARQIADELEDAASDVESLTERLEEPTAQVRQIITAFRLDIDISGDDLREDIEGVLNEIHSRIESAPDEDNDELEDAAEQLTKTLETVEADLQSAVEEAVAGVSWSFE